MTVSSRTALAGLSLPFGKALAVRPGRSAATKVKET